MRYLRLMVGMIFVLSAAGTIVADDTPRPHLFLLSNAANPAGASMKGSAVRLDEFRKAIQDNDSLRRRWNALIEQANHDLAAEVVLPGSYRGGGREESQRKIANRDYDVCFAAGQWIQRAALARLVTGDNRYRDSAWKQIESLFNHPEWSEWQDQAHLGRQPADLRTGMFALDLALAYDWLYDSLTIEQRKWFVDGLDRRAIQPFWQCVERKASWTIGGNNWCTVIVGGLGVLGMSWFGVVGSASKNGVLKWFHEETSFVPTEPISELPNGGRECCLPLWILLWRLGIPLPRRLGSRFQNPDL